ncbi:hypothetical protein CAPTEDRAFT_213175, partial [Capitella teleta]
ISMNSAAWIGASRENGTWTWVTSRRPITFTSWVNETKKKQHGCARIWKKDGLWHSIACKRKNKLKSICEKKVSATDQEWVIPVAITSITFVMMVVIVLIIYSCWRKKYAKKIQNDLGPEDSNPYYNACAVKDDYDSENESYDNQDAVYTNVSQDGEPTFDSRDKENIYATPIKTALDKDDNAVFMVDNSVYQ